MFTYLQCTIIMCLPVCRSLFRVCSPCVLTCLYTGADRSPRSLRSRQRTPRLSMRTIRLSALWGHGSVPHGSQWEPSDSLLSEVTAGVPHGSQWEPSDSLLSGVTAAYPTALNENHPTLCSLRSRQRTPRLSMRTIRLSALWGHGSVPHGSQWEPSDSLLSEVTAAYPTALNENISALWGHGSVPHGSQWEPSDSLLSEVTAAYPTALNENHPTLCLSEVTAAYPTALNENHPTLCSLRSRQRTPRLSMRTIRPLCSLRSRQRTPRLSMRTIRLSALWGHGSVPHGSQWEPSDSLLSEVTAAYPTALNENHPDSLLSEVTAAYPTALNENHPTLCSLRSRQRTPRLSMRTIRLSALWGHGSVPHGSQWEPSDSLLSEVTAAYPHGSQWEPSDSLLSEVTAAYPTALNENHPTLCSLRSRQRTPRLSMRTIRLSALWGHGSVPHGSQWEPSDSRPETWFVFRKLQDASEWFPLLKRI